jgi:hypothetical protein
MLQYLDLPPFSSYREQVCRDLAISRIFDGTKQEAKQLQKPPLFSYIAAVQDTHVAIILISFGTVSTCLKKSAGGILLWGSGVSLILRIRFS